AFGQDEIAARLVRVGLCLPVVGRGDSCEQVSARDRLADFRGNADHAAAKLREYADGDALVPRQPTGKMQRWGPGRLRGFDGQGSELSTIFRKYDLSTRDPRRGLLGRGILVTATEASQGEQDGHEAVRLHGGGRGESAMFSALRNDAKPLAVSAAACAVARRTSLSCRSAAGRSRSEVGA